MKMNRHLIMVLATGAGLVASVVLAFKAGMKADIIALDMDAPPLKPAGDIVSLLLYSAHASDVCMTMVDGKSLYENGEFLTMDRDKVMANARSAQKMLY